MGWLYSEQCGWGIVFGKYPPLFYEKYESDILTTLEVARCAG